MNELALAGTDAGARSQPGRPATVGRHLATALAVLSVAFAAVPARAQSSAYSFTRIADSTQVPALSSATCAAMNGGGTVLFVANGVVWSGSGSALSQVAQAGAAGTPLLTSCPGINDAGDIVYGFNNASPTYLALVKKSGSTLTNLARSDVSPFLVLPGGTGIHSLTGGGSTVVTGGDGRLYVMPAGTPAFTLGPTDPALSSILAGTMNESGTVVFRAVRTIGGGPKAGIYRGSGTPLIEDGSSSTVLLVGNVRPGLNDSGRVVFVGQWFDGTTRVVSTTNGTTFTDHSGTIATAATQAVSINNSGVVVFTTTIPSGNTGVFKGPDLGADRVIAPGDVLDGSTVVQASVGFDAVNNNAQVTFWAQLADGRYGIYRASPLVAPTASNGSLSTTKNIAASGTLVASDPLGGPLVYSIVTNGSRGTAAITNASTGAYTYTPHANAIGSDTFTFKANNGGVDSNVATITVTIGAGAGGNAAPVAQAGGSGPAAAVRFDGAADLLSRTTNLPPIASFTMMGWFRVMGDTTMYSSFLAFGHATSTDTYRLMRCCGGGWQELNVNTGVGGGYASLAPNSWHHLALSVSGTGAGTVKAYVDGNLVLTTSGNPAAVAQSFFIGGDGRGFWLNGSISSVKLYDAALTAAEVTAEMAQFTPVRTANLNAFYPLQSAAAAASDLSGNDRTLTVGGTLTTDPNGPPLTAGSPFSTNEDAPLNATLQATDADGNPLTFILVSNGTKGTVVITNPSTGAFTYTPNPHATGTDSFSFKANDGLVDSNVATVSVTITAANDAPLAADGSATVTAGSSTGGTLSATDVDSSSLTYAIVANGAKGTATITNPATGAYTYAANSGTSATDTFTFRANDGSLNSNTATITVTISPSPIPSANNGTLAATEDVVAAGTLTGNDPNSLPLTYSIVTNGTKGVATITNASTGAYTYTPSANANGADSFTFRVTNGTQTSSAATISVTIVAVNDAPVASNGTAAVQAGATVTGTLVATDIDSASRTFSIVANGAKGTATITNPGTGAYSYTANVGTSGTDTFTFRANDGAANSNTATITVTITAVAPVNHAPVAQGSASGPAAAVRFDAVGESLSRTSALPPIGTFTMMGWFRILGDTTTYSSFMALGHGSSNDTYRMMRCCGGGWQELNVNTGAGGGYGGSLAPNNTWHHLALTVAGTGAGQLKAYVDGTLVLTASGNAAVPAQALFIGNDGRGFWLNGSAAAVKIYAASLTQAEVTAEMQQFAPVRTANLNAFYPLQSAATAGTDYSGNDRSLLVSGALATDASGPPLTVGTPLTTNEDTPLNGTLVATDSDGNPLTYSIVTNGTKGTVVITNASTGAFTYTPNANATGADGFTFKANDGALDSNIATIHLAISPLNDAPVASNGAAAVTSGTSVNGTLAATDIDSGSLTYSIVTNGAKGTATITNAATGAYTYAANGGTSGADTFTFRANDGSVNSNTATITVTIATSPAPLANNGTLAVTEDTARAGTLSASDPHSLPLTYSIVTNGSKGTATITNPSTGAYTYTPFANAHGADGFTFRATNGTYMSNTATVSVTIAAVNDVPVASSSAASVNAGGSVSSTLIGTDADNDTLSFIIVSNGTKGTATVTNASTGAFTYTANTGTSGTDTFTFRVADGTVNSNVATVTITITTGAPANRAPIPLAANGAAASVRFDAIADELFRTTNLPSATSFTMMGWFKFVGDTNAYSTFLRLGHGTTSNGHNLLRCCGGGWRELDMWNGAGIWTVASPLTLGSWYHFAVTVEGTGAGQVKTYVNGTLVLSSPGNPAITADRFSIGNDAHQEWLNGNAAAIKLYSAVLTGAEVGAEMNRLAPVRTTNLNGYYPLQANTSAINDFGGGNRSLTQGGTLATDVSGPPVQTGFTTARNTVLNGRLWASDPDGNPITFSLQSGSANGTVVVNASGTFTYTPTANFTGTTSFVFRVSDGTASATATVSITVTP